MDNSLNTIWGPFSFVPLVRGRVIIGRVGVGLPWRPSAMLHFDCWS